MKPVFFTLVTFIAITTAQGKTPGNDITAKVAAAQNHHLVNAPLPAPPPVIGTGHGLNGAYYNHTSAGGFPVYARIDSTIDFEFTYTKQPVVLSPVPGIVPEDYYSVHWEGTVQAQYSEEYTFYTLSDDGIRVWVNDVQLIDNWVNQGPTEKTGTITLTAGQQYKIVIDYYENTGESVSKLSWSSASTPKQIVPKSQLYSPVAVIGTGTGLQASYYNGVNGSSSGSAAILTRVDTSINMECSYAHLPLSPAPGVVPQDSFSVSWEGEIQAQFTETYTFYIQSDDGSKVSIAGSPLINNWANQGVTEKTGSITLIAGNRYWISISYYENAGDAIAKLLWSSASTPKQLVPKSQLYPNFSSTRIASNPTPQPLLTPPADKSFAATIFGNPVRAGQTANLQINSQQRTAATIGIISSNGALISSKRVNLAEGRNTVPVNTAGWAQGLYLINIVNAGKPVTLKLLVE